MWPCAGGFAPRAYPADPAAAACPRPRNHSLKHKITGSALHWCCRYIIILVYWHFAYDFFRKRETVSHEEIAKIIKKSVKSNLFNGEELFDIYQGEHIQEGFKSMAFRIKMQDKDGTLTDEAVEEQMTSIRNNLKKSVAELSFRE